jgi:putative Mg2+ transporter-C (MgtC) family protein
MVRPAIARAMTSPEGLAGRYHVLNDLDFAARIACAFAFGAFIGVERQWRQRDAGLRTNTLVAVGAALFVVTTAFLHDPSETRIAAYVVSGIGFLGGGVILKEGATVRGLNTAATLWCSAAVGVLAGSGLLRQAALGTAAVLMVHMTLRPLAQWMTRRSGLIVIPHTTYDLRVVCQADDEAHIRRLLLSVVHSMALTLLALSSANLDGAPRAEVRAELALPLRDDRVLEQIVSRLSLERAVSAVRWQVAVTHHAVTDDA